MSTVNIGDIVVNTSDNTIFGEAIPESPAVQGLHPNTRIDLWGGGDAGPAYADSGLVAVRWYLEDGETYDWWEDPEFLVVVSPSTASVG